MGVPADMAVVAAALQAVEAFFDVVEGLLQKRNYMAGDKFTLADVYYIPMIQRLFACGYGDVVVSRRAVNDWWERCAARPAIRDVLAADAAAMKSLMQK